MVDAMPWSLRMVRAAAPLWPSHRGWFRLSKIARDRVPASHRQGVFTTAMGTRLRLDLNDYPDFSMAAGVYERSTVRLFERLLRPGMNVVDCGANLGYFATLAAKLVGASGRVDAIEPDPINRVRLEENIALNHQQSVVRVHAAAVGNDAATLRMTRSSGDFSNHGEASLVATHQGEAFDVRVDRADVLVDRVPDLVKIDVEGFEVRAIEGMSSWMRSTKPPTLVVECNRKTLEDAGASPVVLLELIQSLVPGAEVWEIDWPMKRVTRQSCESVDSQDRNWWVKSR
jgi:FkbM family methyltransferase